MDALRTAHSRRRTASRARRAASFARTLASYAPEGLLAALFALAIAAPPAYAYVDPSVMTYTIQALAGVTVALSAVLGVALRKTRRKLMKLFHIDENARKTVEPDVHRVDPHAIAEGDGLSPGAAEAAAPADSPAARSRKAPSGRRAASAAPLRWRSRFLLMLAACLFASLTLLAVAPLETVAANASSLIFSLETVAGPVLALSCGTGVAAALALSALRGRAFDAAFGLVIAFGLACYLQAMLLNFGLPAADGSHLSLIDHLPATIASALVWIALFAGALFLSAARPAAMRAAGCLVALALAVVQCAGVVSLALDASRDSSSGESLSCTEDGLFELSPGHNVVVIVVDTYDTDYFDHVLEQYPEQAGSFEDFTYFHNTTGSLIPTAYAIPYLLTDELPRTDETFDAYRQHRYERGAFLQTLAERGYDIGIYSDSMGLDFEPDSSSEVAAATINVMPERELHFNTAGALASLAKCALYRDAPWIAKPLFWYYTDELNNAMARSDDAASNDHVAYRIDDASFMRSLSETGLQLSGEGAEPEAGFSPTDGKSHEESLPAAGDAGAAGDAALDSPASAAQPGGSFRFIHLLGAHYPYTLDEDGMFVGEENASFDSQLQGSLAIVGAYLEQMKQLGIYDTSTIIVTADHGKWYLTDQDIQEPSCPLLLAKPARSHAEALRISEGSLHREAMAITDVPASHLDIDATIYSEIGADTEAQGVPLFSLTDAPRSRVYYETLSNGTRNFAIREFAIDGHALDFSAWSLTGNEWAIE